MSILIRSDPSFDDREGSAELLTDRGAVALRMPVARGRHHRPDQRRGDHLRFKLIGPLTQPAAVALILLLAFSLSWVWTTLALILRTPHAVNVAGLVFLFPLTFTSNIFVAPRTMPGWLQAFVDVNPVSRVVTATRNLMHGTVAVAEVAWVLVACAVLAAVFAPLTTWLYRSKG